ncbi:MAG: ACP S-malonyltransferase [Patescibacteria group bacterium]
MSAERRDRTPRQEGKEPLKNQKIAFVFPGQGSQEVGMGFDIFQKSPAARRVFQEADDVLEFNLSKIIFEGPAEALKDTINSQPAILTVSMAAFEAWKEQSGGKGAAPMLNAGHSLGEYSALVAAKVLTFGDAVKLVRERGRLMKQASKKRPGSMAAIVGLDEEALEHICSETGVEIGNINTDTQMVVTGDKRAIARAMDLAGVRGATKVTRLGVSGAFHSSLMESAKNGLQQKIASTLFNPAEVPIVANSSTELLTNPNDIRMELVEGLCKPVLWSASVKKMANRGVTAIVEFGPGRVLSGLARQIDRELTVIPINSVESASKFAQLLKQPPIRNNPQNA